MERLTLDSAKKIIYEDGIFGGGGHVVHIRQRTQGDDVARYEDLSEYGVFDEKKCVWREYIKTKYTEKVDFFSRDFVFIHFANIDKIAMEFRGESSRNKSTRSNLLQGNQGRENGIREGISDELKRNYNSRYIAEKVTITKAEKSKNKQNYGDLIGAIIDVNQYLIIHYCENYARLSDRIDELIFICENDDSLLWNKEIFLRHIKAYVRNKEVVEDESEEWANDMGYVLSWLLLAALLRESFATLAQIIPNIEIKVQLRSEEKYNYLKIYLKKRIDKQIREIVQSYQIEMDRRLFPKGVYYQDDRSFSCSVDKLLEKSWDLNKGIRKNQMIIGEGGIGKTLSILQIISKNRYEIPVIYVPLNEVGGNGLIPDTSMSFEKNITWYIRDRFQEQYEIIESICKKEPGMIPNIIIYLDGYNEIRTNCQGQILKEIRYFDKEYKGAQIILSSRAELDYRGKFGLLISESLDERIVSSIFSEKGIHFDGNKSIISTPLMLHLCCKLETIKKAIGNEYYSRLDWREIKSTADVFWNYIQMEIVKHQANHTFDCVDGVLEMDYYYVALLLCPYVSWRMENKQLIHIGEKELKILIIEAMQYLDMNANLYDDVIKDVMLNEDGRVIDERSQDVKANAYFIILLKSNLLMRYEKRNNEKTICLLHQKMREYLAALFVRNALYRDMKQGFLLPEVTRTMNEEVLSELSDSMSDKEVDELWNRIKVKTEEAGYGYYCNSVNWFLRFYGIKYNQDYSGIDFSNMDLSSISLAECLDYRYKSTLPSEAWRFNNTKISSRTFSRVGHMGGVSAIRIISELNIVVTGDYYGKVYVWDLVNALFLFELSSQEKRLYKNRDFNKVFEIQYIRVKDKYYIAIGTFVSIDLFCVNQEGVAETNQGLITPIYSIGIRDVDIYSVDYNGKKLCLFENDDLFLCNAADTGEVSIYNISKKEYVKVLKLGIRINKIEVYNYENKIYCIVAGSDFSVVVWNVSDNTWNKMVCKVKYPEGPRWQGGIRDFEVYNYNGIFNMVFSDQFGDIRIAEDIFSGKAKTRLLRRGHSEHVDQIVVYQDNDKVEAFSSAYDRTIIRWDLKTGKMMEKIDYTKPERFVDSIGIKKIDEKTLAIIDGRKKRVGVFDIVEDQIRFIHGQEIDDLYNYDVEKRNDTIRVVTGGFRGVITDWVFREEDNSISNRFLNQSDGVFTASVFKRSDEKEYLALAHGYGEISIYDFSCERCVALFYGDGGLIEDICPCCEGNKLILGGRDGTVKILDITDFEIPRIEAVLNGHSAGIMSCEVINDGASLKFVTYAVDANFIVWEKTYDSFSVIRIGNRFRKECLINGKKCKDVRDIDSSDLCESDIRVVKVIDSNRIITGGFNGEMVLWYLDKLASQKGIVIGKHKDPVHNIFFIGNERKKNVVSISVKRELIQYDYDDLTNNKSYLVVDNEKSISLTENYKEIDIDRYINSHGFGLWKNGLVYDVGWTKALYLPIFDEKKEMKEKDGLFCISDECYYPQELLSSKDFDESSLYIMDACDNTFVFRLEGGRIVIKDFSSEITRKKTTLIEKTFDISVFGMDFSKAIICDDDLKNRLKQNGAIV